MKYLEEIIESLPTSKPVFKILLNRDADAIQFELANEHKPSVSSNDPLEALIIEFYDEELDVETCSMKKSSYISRRCIDRMRDVILNTYVANCGLKKPRMSHMYKFLCKRLIDEKSLCDIYRYIKPTLYAEEKNNSYLMIDNISVKLNFMKILENLKDKYDSVKKR